MPKMSGMMAFELLFGDFLAQRDMEGFVEGSGMFLE